ncbi:MAG TPA: insulinase family protein [Vicinamibacterales bacterium]|nr:insulinase family protein [Vicinamibacterales bacterium]
MRQAALILALSVAPSIAAAQTTAAPVAPVAQKFSPQDVIPFDAAVTKGTLPNGLTYFIRKNGRPANRVLLRLAVKAGSLDEADDQQGLAHMLEHMAFNGSAHFPPGALVSYFESVGMKLGPHVNAYTSFTETVFMLDLPTGDPGVVNKGLLALSDFAGGLTLDPKEIDKERGVVIEEWRGGLGAASRIRDKQIPVLYHDSRYAERLPIGKPEILRTFQPERLRAFYDTYYRPDRIGVIVVGDIDPQTIQSAIETTFGPLKARAPEPAPRNATVPLDHETLVSVATDPEVTQSSVAIVRKRPREGEAHVADYRRDLVERFFDQMLNERFDEIGRRPDAKFLDAGASGGDLSKDVATFSLGAAVQDGHIPDGLTAIVVEAHRAREYGFTPPELDRTKRTIRAFYDRAYSERDKTESASYASEYLQYFLEGEPSPGIAYEYALVQQLLPGITDAEVSAMGKDLLAGDTRVILAVSPQKPGIAVPTDVAVRTTLTSAEKVPVTAWTEAAETRPLMPKVPEPAPVTSRREIADLGVTVVQFGNGVEAWLKPTAFKNDQVLFSLSGFGGASLAPPADYPDASLASFYVGLSGAGGLSAVDLQKLLAGKLASSSPFISLSTQGISGSSSPADLETALQLLYQQFTAPGDDPQAFALLQRQLSAVVVNRQQNPQAVFGEKLNAVNTSNNYTTEPLTVARVEALDRTKMAAFYRDRFSNAADFRFFMVGAFKVDDAVALLARYVGTLPSTGKRTSAFKQVGMAFPLDVKTAQVDMGREPRSQTVISFFADPPMDPVAQERVGAATDVLETALRDILREELGQTYTVSVGLQQPLPQRGEGHVAISFGSAPENVGSMTKRVMDEVKALRTNGPSEDLVNRAKEAALRGYETALEQNGYWLGRLQNVVLFDQDPGLILTRKARIDAITPAIVKQTFQTYFPLDRYTVVTLMPAK